MKILGIRIGESYTDVKNLRYDSIMIMTLTYERNLNSDIVKKLKEEISENNLNKISQTNVILRTNLKKLFERVNNWFNQITKQKQFIKKLNEDSKNKEKTPLEEELKMKEMQLNSSKNLIESLSKENKSLKEKLEIYGDYKMNLLDSIKLKDSEIQ